MTKKVLTEIAEKVLALDNVKDVEMFFRAFFTPKEVSVLEDRYHIIEMLLQKIPQREISKRLGVSISQISRGSEELQFGIGKDIFPKICGKDEK